MDRRNFLALLSAGSISGAGILSQHAYGLPSLVPVYQLLLDSQTPPPGGVNWLDSVGLLPNDHPELLVTDRSNAIYVDGDAVAQGNGTMASPYKDFYFLGGRNSAGQRFKSSVPIDPADTVIYVKGTFRHSDHEQDTPGQFLRVHVEQDQMSNGLGGFNPFTANQPLIFAPWPGQPGPVFDAENGVYPSSSGNSGGDNCPVFASGSASLFTDVEFRGFTVRNGVCGNRILFFQGTRTARLISCRVHDGQPPNSSPSMSGGVAFEMSSVDAQHLVRHCEIYNNAASVTNNIGEVSWRSQPSATNRLNNRLVVEHSIIRNSHRGFTGKHSGESTVIGRNNLVHTMAAQGVYARGGDIIMQYSVFRDCAGLCQPDYQNLNAPQNLQFDHNTVVDCRSIINTTNDTPALANGPVTVSLSNNAFLDSDFSDAALRFQTLYDDNTTPTPDTLSSVNNRFGFASAAANVFYSRQNQPSQNFAQAMVSSGDSGSLFAHPDIDSVTLQPIANGNCDSTGSGGTNIGAL